jgi:hypothetical protein
MPEGERENRASVIRGKTGNGGSTIRDDRYEARWSGGSDTRSREAKLIEVLVTLLQSCRDVLLLHGNVNLTFTSGKCWQLRGGWSPNRRCIGGVVSLGQTPRLAIVVGYHGSGVGSATAFATSVQEDLLSRSSDVCLSRTSLIGDSNAFRH